MNADERPDQPEASHGKIKVLRTSRWNVEGEELCVLCGLDGLECGLGVQCCRIGDVELLY
jgi:hypothetical protein